MVDADMVMRMPSLAVAGETGSLDLDEGSNPFGSTETALTVNKLVSFTDKRLTRMNYKLPEIYDADGDMQKYWLIHFSYKQKTN